MTGAPERAYGVHVDLVGDDVGSEFGALRALLGSRLTVHVRSSLRSQPFSVIWWFAYRNDAEHASELARGLLGRGNIAYSVRVVAPEAVEVEP